MTRAPPLFAVLFLLGPSASAAAAKSGYASANGVRIYYEVVGRGPPVVLVHGGGSDHRRFDELSPLLAKSYTVVLPDMRGRGRSTDRDEPFTYAAMAKDVLAVLDALGLERAHVAGWSDGGIVALELAQRHPDRLLSAAAFGANGTPEGLTEETRAEVSALSVKSYRGDGRYKEVAPDPSHWPKVVEKLKDMWLHQPQFTQASLAKVRVPVLIAAGDHDSIKLEHTAWLFRSVPGAQLFIAPGSGHSLRHQDLDVASRVLVRFFRGERLQAPAR